MRDEWISSATSFFERSRSADQIRAAVVHRRIGTLKSVAIAPAEVEGAFTEGLGFDGSAIEGLTRTFESDMLAHPDPATFQNAPVARGDRPTARMFCDITTPDGQPAVADPRNVLKRTLEKAAERGFTFYTHPEIEFYLLKSSTYGIEGPEPVDSAGYFDNVPGGTAHDFRRRSVRMLEDLGISVEFSHHEAGPGQNEIDLRYADGLTTADNIMTFRTVVKEVAIEQGVYATFMPKPLSGHPGRGCTPTCRCSRVTPTRSSSRRAVPTVQARASVRRGTAPARAEITAVTNQFVNSYKRLWGGDEAPSSCAGVTTTGPRSSGSRCTSRARGGVAGGIPRDRLGGNPYLAFSLMLAAGLKGIEGDYELPPEAEDNVWNLTTRNAARWGYSQLPASLDHAVSNHGGFGTGRSRRSVKQVFNYVLLNKRQEWKE